MNFKIKPYSGFADEDIADYPALKMYFHSDDEVDGTTSITDRVNGVKINFLQGLLKTSEGLAGDAANSIVSIDGTIPIVSNHVLFGLSGKSFDSPELLSGLGKAPSNYPVLAANGLIFDSAGGFKAPAVNLVPSPAAITDHQCTMAQFDLVDTVNPKISAVQAGGLANGIPFGTGTTIDGNQIILGAPFTTLDLTPLVNEISKDWFLKQFFVFDFQDPITEDEMKIASTEMLRTGKPFAKWRGRS